MRIKSLHVKNFRALEEIDVEFDSAVSVIVGPNAVGKTTLLEAIRLAKAVVAPRSQNEASQALLALGATVPYNPQRIIPSGIARDLKRSVEIRCRYQLEPLEISTLLSAMPEIATDFTLRSAGRNQLSPSANVSFLSSAEGRDALSAAEKLLRSAIDAVNKGAQNLFLDFLFDPSSGRATSSDPVGGTFFGFLDSSNPPTQTTFSYFPADRALPPGEQPVQLGAIDAANQIESHVAQPQLKYSRLKNTIFNAVVSGEQERTQLLKDFERIFEGILRGRKVTGVGVNQFGLLSISVQDIETGRTFELDGMSSGEKGLILTCLLIGRSIADGGIILLDEPELHLNPAVCKDLLSFLVDNYIRRKNLQAIICSHSPEILAGAFDKDECSLYHLVSENVLSKVHYRDQDEISQALGRLGTSEGEGLLYRATVFVEGVEDVDLLQVGFGDLLRRHKLKDLGGRREVEKLITRLQDAEQKGNKLSPRYFIFDRDEVPANIKDSEAVKVLQWDRRCLENYLIDLEVLTTLLKDADIVREPFANQGEVSKLIRDLAMSQIDEFVARAVYATYEFDDPNPRTAEIRGKTIGDISRTLAGRLKKISSQIEARRIEDWTLEFMQRCEEARAQEVLVWDARWTELCDGKRLFQELVQQRPFRISLSKLKRRIMLGMRIGPTPNWRSVESLLKGLLGP